MRNRSRKTSCKEMWRIRWSLTPAILHDPDLYLARRNLLKAYRRLCSPTNLDDVGHARVHAYDALDLLKTILDLKDPNAEAFLADIREHSDPWFWIPPAVEDS